MVSQQIKQDILFLGNEEKAQLKNRFFKNKEGQYGFGDVFVGLSNPEMHQISKHYYAQITLDELPILLKDEIHEIRFVALSIMVLKFKKCKIETDRKTLVDIYLAHVNFINNWDLVDCSCMYILGAYLLDKQDRSILDKLAKSNHLWSERIAMVSTWYFIKHQQFDDTFRIASILLSHPHDLIHKAIGWMLREAWSKGAKERVEEYLEQNITKIPRTTLRYTIEKMEETERKEFLKLK